MNLKQAALEAHNDIEQRAFHANLINLSRIIVEGLEELKNIVGTYDFEVYACHLRRPATNGLVLDVTVRTISPLDQDILILMQATTFDGARHWRFSYKQHAFSTLAQLGAAIAAQRASDPETVKL